jgi:hypothetical protein
MSIVIPDAQSRLCERESGNPGRITSGFGSMEARVPETTWLIFPN